MRSTFLHLGLLLALSATAQPISFQHVISIGSAANDYLRALTMDDEGTTYVAVQFQDTLVIGDSTFVPRGHKDTMVGALTPDGNWLWAVRMGGEDPVSNSIEGFDQMVAPDGYLHCAMSFDWWGATAADWPGLFGSGEHVITMEAATGHVLAVQTSSNFKLAGAPDGGTYRLNDSQTMLARVDLNGNTLWSIPIPDGFGVRELCPLSDGSLMACGNSNGVAMVPGAAWDQDLVDFNPAFEYWVMRIHPDGTIAWARHIEDEPGSEAYLLKLSADSTGGAFGLGRLGSNSPNLSLGGIYLAPPAPYVGVGFLCHITSEGSWDYALRLGPTGSQNPQLYGPSATGTFLLRGAYSGTDNVSGEDLFGSLPDPEPEVNYLAEVDSELGWMNMFTCNYNQTNITASAFAHNGIHDHVSVAGPMASGAQYFDGHPLSHFGGNDCFVALTDLATVGISEDLSAGNFGVDLFPNPTSGTCHIQIPLLCMGNQLQVFDAQGALLINELVRASTMDIELGDQPTGLYLVVCDGLMKRVIKE
jgi:hypothetical protein